MSKWSALFKLPKVYRLLKKWRDTQTNYLNQNTLPEVDAFFTDESLNQKDRDKIEKYYGLGVPAIIGEFICFLRNQEMSLTERKASTYQGVITGLFDDLFDEKEADDSYILDLMNHPYEHVCKEQYEALICHSFAQFDQVITDHQMLQKVMKQIYDVQVLTRIQTNDDIDRELLLQITKDKGGHSVVFFVLPFVQSMTQHEIDAWYKVGAAMQYGNDLFDVYKDSQAGIYTLPILNTNLSRTKQEITQLLNDAMKALSNLPYSKGKIEFFKSTFLFAMARCFVCLEQFENLLPDQNAPFQVENYSRSELICDMEKPKNLWKSVQYFLKYYS